MLDYFEPYECSSPYIVGVEHGSIIYAVDVLYVNVKTNQSYIGVDYFSRKLENEDDEDLLCNVF